MKCVTMVPKQDGRCFGDLHDSLSWHGAIEKTSIETHRHRLEIVST